MNKKGKGVAAAGLILSIFLFLCAVIDFASGHMGAAVGALGAGIFFFAVSSAACKKSKENK